MIQRLVFALSTGFVVCASLLVAEEKVPAARLQQLLKAYPKADANKDGKLTIEEAKAYLAANPELRQKGKDGAPAKTDGKDAAPTTDSALPAPDLRLLIEPLIASPSTLKSQ